MSRNNLTLRSSCLKVSVTAILAVKSENFKDILLVGYGPTLEVYKDAKLISSNDILNGSSSNIHGFQVSPYRSDSGHESTFKVLVFGGKHFSCAQIDSSGSIVQCTLVKQCEDWIFAVKWISHEEVVFLSAHNRVLRARILDSDPLIIWSKRTECKEKCILYSGALVDHDTSKVAVLAGTVFSELIIWCLDDTQEEINVDHKLKGHEGVIFSVKFCTKNSLICTTSDDRSARVWKVVSTDSNIKWNSCNITCLFVMNDFHTSRIFCSVFIGKAVITFGEDSSYCIWSLENGLKTSWKRSAHDGAPIWSSDVTSCENIMFTGGADGALKLWHLSESNQITSTRLEYPKCDGDFAKIVKVFDDQTVVCLTHKGRLFAFCGEISNRVISDSDLESYALMEIVNGQIIFATLNGQVKVYNVERQGMSFTQNLEVNQPVFNSKIFSLNNLNDKLFLLCGSSGNLKVLSIVAGALCVHDEFLLPQVSGQRWVSSALLCSDNRLIIGDRCGNLHVYVPQFPDPIQSLFKLHSRLGVSFLKCKNDTLFTAGRDGLIQTLRVHDTDKDVLTKVSTTRTKFNVIEELFEIDGQVFALGFHSEKVIIYNLSLDYINCEVSCGGGHRSWATRKGFLSFQFYYLRDKFIEHIHIPLTILIGSKVLRDPVHSLEINTVAFFQLREKSFVATGSEDTRIKIFEVDSAGGSSLKNILSLDGHISSVKSITTFPTSNENETFIISVGGRAQLKIWNAIMNPDSFLFVSQMQSNMLKGNDKRRKKTWKDQILINDAETRYMDVVTTNSSEGSFSILTAGSDGALRKFEYDIAQDRLELSEESYPHEKFAFLKIALCEDEEHFLTSNTRGNVSLWSHVQLQKLMQIQAHLSGINSLHCLGNDIFTGGDDGALAWISMERKNMKLNAISLQECLHSAHVTGILSHGEFIFSSSVDQRVSIWKVDRNSLDNPLKLVCQKLSYVPDIHDMAIGHTENGDPFLVVVGAGIQLFKLLEKD